MLPLHQFFVSGAALLPILATSTAASIIVTGVQVDPTAASIPPRRNIVDLQSTGGPQWDLYIQALQAMQAANSTDPSSYFQIAGIHGKPFFEYDGTGPKNTAGWEGYCPHIESLFLPWHRPYVVLFEQILVEHARKIALTYPEAHRTQYIEAADTLRAPFWDWATDEAVPEATVPQKMSINIPADRDDVESKEVDNPLYTFKFPEAVLDGQFGTFAHGRRSQTYRCTEPFMSYPATANENLKVRNYKSLVYDAFTRSADFSQFATMEVSGVSLEAIHGGIHWDAGCRGQFLELEFTGFDPLFMLHHANVDRLWAYWEAMRPDQRVFTGEYLARSRWATRENTTITTKSPLEPFRRSESDFHTSESVQSIYDLGYSYHGLEYKDNEAEQKRQEVTRIINRLEPGSGGLSGRRENRRRAVRTRYFAHLRVELSEVERPCSIELSMNGTHAGNLVLMSMPESGMAYGEVPLDAVHDKLRGKSDSVVLDTLESWLEIDIIKADGSEVRLVDVPSLGLEIERVQVTTPQTDTELPRYSGSKMFGVKVGKKVSGHRGISAGVD